MANGKKTTIRIAKGDKIFYAVTMTLLSILTRMILLPLINILASSFSEGKTVTAGKVFLWPVNFSLEGYKAVFEYNGIGIAYLNTIFYTVAGTAINLALTMMCGFALSRKDVPLRGLFVTLFAITMFFNGGTIPNYINMSNLGLINSRWAMLLPGAMSVYNMVIARTFIQGIPNDLWEAADIDGCNEFHFFFKVVMPLSVTLLTVLGLFYAVGHWNAYFNAFLYLSDRNLMPLQVKLREILILNSVEQEFVDEELLAAKEALVELLKYSLIVVSSAPVLLLYPFCKKYFMRGVLLGSLKG